MRSQSTASGDVQNHCHDHDWHVRDHWHDSRICTRHDDAWAEGLSGATVLRRHASEKQTHSLAPHLIASDTLGTIGYAHLGAFSSKDPVDDTACHQPLTAHPIALETHELHTNILCRQGADVIEIAAARQAA